MKFEGFPFVIGFELTLACNLRCKHCASSAGRPRVNELSLNEILNICDQFPDLLVQEVDFTGGEPLLHSEWARIAIHLHKLNIPVRMVSNGILLKDNISRIVDSGIATFGISIDGLESTHDHIREKPGLFKQIISGVEAALAADIPIAVITAVNNHNVGELPQLYTILHGLGVRLWQVQPIFSRGRAQEEKLHLSESSFLEMGEFVHSHVTGCDSVGFNMMPADGVGYFTELDTRNTAWQGCAAGMATCGITADGKVKGCLSFPDHLVEGDLRKQDLWSIWFDKTSFIYNRRFLLEDLGENCTNCEFGEQCRGGCSVMSYTATQQFHNNPYCFHRILSHGHK
ncbi:MAG: radical SAM protein [Thermodesulfobacteriota bacterium]|nr:radical SAM protein [Thermodesulfobacteriota bacterium]